MEDKLFEFIARYMPLTDAEKQVIIDLGLFKRYEKGTLPEHFFKPLIISELDINPSDKGSYTVTP